MIIRKIIKIAATRCHILKLKCTKFDFGWSSTPDHAGELTALPQTPQLDLRSLLLSGGEGRERGEGRTREGTEGAGRERGRREEKGRRKRRDRGKGAGGEGEWASLTHYFRLKSCTVADG